MVTEGSNEAAAMDEEANRREVQAAWATRGFTRPILLVDRTGELADVLSVVLNRAGFRWGEEREHEAAVARLKRLTRPLSVVDFQDEAEAERWTATYLRVLRNRTGRIIVLRDRSPVAWKAPHALAPWVYGVRKPYRFEHLVELLQRLAVEPDEDDRQPPFEMSKAA